MWRRMGQFSLFNSVSPEYENEREIRFYIKKSKKFIFVNQVFIGCYLDNIQPQLTGLTQQLATCLNEGTLQDVYYIDSNSMTISYCISLCFTYNFQYAGLKNG